MKKKSNDDIDTLRAEVEKGLRFIHTLGMQSKIDLVDLSTRVLTVIELLVASGNLDLRAYQERSELISKREADRMHREGHVHVMLNDVPDKYAMSDLPEIDCALRLGICKARCCKLSFPLAIQDLDERIVQWEYGHPYHIRQREDGYCCHNTPKTRACGVYDSRPAVCRSYDCRKDERIWKDFEQGILAAEQ